MLLFLYTLTDESNIKKVENIYETYYSSMIKYARIKLGSAGRQNAEYDAEDAVQSAFMKIVKYINNIDFSRDKNDVKNYCFAILNNEIVRILGEEEIVLENIENFCLEDDYNLIDQLCGREKYDQIVKCIETMDERYSTTLFLFYCKEMAAVDIADLMGIAKETVYTRLMRGRKILFNSIKEVN